MLLTLTPKERTCLKWIAAGKTSYETGAILDISPRTVDYHIYNVCLKFGVQSRQTAVAVAVVSGLFPNIHKLLPKLPTPDQGDDPAPVHEKTR